MRKKVKNCCNAEMKTGEVGRSQVILSLIEHAQIFTQKNKKLLKDLTVWGYMR